MLIINLNMENRSKRKHYLDNKGLAKAGGQWLIERLCLLFILVLGDSEVLFMPAFAKPRTVKRNCRGDRIST